MSLDRISEEHYTKHLQEIALAKWGKLTEIESAWLSVCEAEKADVLLSMSKLSLGQRAVLVQLAKQAEAALFNQGLASL